MSNYTHIFRQRIRLFKWLIPLGLVLLVIGYELGPSRWIFNDFGLANHLLAEIILFGTIGPALVFVMMELFDRWVEERETAEVQSSLLAQAREKELEVRQVGDDTLQVLFATSLLLTSFKAEELDLPSSTATQIEVTEQALEAAMQRLRSHILS